MSKILLHIPTGIAIEFNRDKCCKPTNTIETYVNYYYTQAHNSNNLKNELKKIYSTKPNKLGEPERTLISVLAEAQICSHGVYSEVVDWLQKHTSIDDFEIIER